MSVPLSALRHRLRIETVYAHCDIPCGIYTPEPARTAARTVETMVKKIEELKPPASAAGTKEWFEFENAVTRLVKVKEEHAETCKHQVLILWTDYFKPEHLKKFPDLHEDVWKTTKLCSKNKQSVDAAAAKELREAVERIADYFGQAEQSKAK